MFDHLTISFAPSSLLCFNASISSTRSMLSHCCLLILLKGNRLIGPWVASASTSPETIHHLPVFQVQRCRSLVESAYSCHSVGSSYSPDFPILLARISSAYSVLSCHSGIKFTKVYSHLTRICLYTLLGGSLPMSYMTVCGIGDIHRDSLH